MNENPGYIPSNWEYIGFSSKDVDEESADGELKDEENTSVFYKDEHEDEYAIEVIREDNNDEKSKVLSIQLQRVKPE